MSRLLRALRIPALAGLLALAFSGSALAAPALDGAPGDEIDVITCNFSCTKTLGPGQRLAVGDRYATRSVNAFGQSDGFGVRFGLKWSPDGVNFVRLRDTERTGTAYQQNLTRFTHPHLFPGHFRLVARNESTWLTMTAGGTLVTDR
jgi:hypothetical protein